MNFSLCFNPREGEKKKKFGVCVKGMSFPTDDLTLKIMEWVEVLKSLGVSTIFLYDLAIHPNVRKLLNHYVEVHEREGILFLIHSACSLVKYRAVHSDLN